VRPTYRGRITASELRNGSGASPGRRSRTCGGLVLCGGDRSGRDAGHRVQAGRHPHLEEFSALDNDLSEWPGPVSREAALTHTTPPSGTAGSSTVPARPGDVSSAALRPRGSRGPSKCATPIGSEAIEDRSVAPRWRRRCAHHNHCIEHDRYDGRLLRQHHRECRVGNRSQLERPSRRRQVGKGALLCGDESAECCLHISGVWRKDAPSLEAPVVDVPIAHHRAGAHVSSESTG
jgi:hypothetical protein